MPPHIHNLEPLILSYDPPGQPRKRPARVKLKRTDGGSVGTVYVTEDGKWRIWRAPYPPRRWYVNATDDQDHTEWADGFLTRREARAKLERHLTSRAGNHGAQ